MFKILFPRRAAQRCKSFAGGILSVGFALGALPVASAASLSWDQAGSGALGGTGTWDTSATNWWNGTADTNWATNTVTGDTAVFAGTAGTVTLGAAINALGLQFTTSGYTITGGTLGLGRGGIDASSLTGGTATLGSNLQLSGAQQWNVGAGGTLAVTGTVTRNTGSSVNFSTAGTINVTGSGLANTNGILGGWATVGNAGTSGASGDFAAVDGSGNIITYAGYTNITGSMGAADYSAQNWKVTNAAAALTASATVNSLVLTTDFSISSGATMTLGSGGLILSGNSRWLKNNGAGSTAGTGQLTSGLGSGEFFIDSSGSASSDNDWRIWTKIVDNGATAVSVVKTGPGYVRLANSNTYTGGTIMNGGALVGDGGSAFGTGAVQVNSGAVTVNLNAGTIANSFTIASGTSATFDNATNNGTINSNISGAGTVTIQNTSGTNLSENIGGSWSGFTGTLNYNTSGKVVNIFAPASWDLSNVTVNFANTGNITNSSFRSSGTTKLGSLAGFGYLDVAGTVEVGNLNTNTTFSGIVRNNGSAGTLRKVGTGTLTLSGASSYTGATTVNAGTLQIGNGSAGSIATTSAVSVANGATLAFNQANNATFSNAIANTGNVKGVQSSGVTNTLSGVISGVGGVTQNSGGTMNLSGVNTYTGATTVNAGTLGLTGAGSINTTSGITVNGATAAFLTGSSATVTPVVTVTLGKAGGSGGGTLGTVNVANNAGAGILTGAGGLNITSLTLDGAATFSWSAAAQLSVDTFTINSSASSITIGSAVAWTTSATPYTILSATTIAGTGAGLSAFTLGDVTSHFTGLTPRQTATAALSGNTITVTIAGDNYPKWTGIGSSAWNTTATNNWQLVNGGAATAFLNGDQVLFDDTASQGTVTINDGNVSVGGVTFNNSALDYTVSGANGMTGVGGLTKSGTGTVTLDTVNSYTGGNTINAGTLIVTGTLGSGGTTINGGTLQMGTGGTTGSFGDASAITNNGSLVFNHSNNLVQGTDFGTISGTGTVTQAGAGALTLGSANSYSGGTTINAGTVIFGNNASFGTGAVTLNGGGLKASSGVTLANNIAVASAATIDMAGNNTGFTGNLSGSAALTFNTSGAASTAALAGNNSGYTGTITLNNNNAVSFNAASAGSAGAAWVFNDGAVDRVRINVGNATIEFGSIAGNGQMQNDTAGTTSTLSVGALGTDTTFGGTMKDNGTGKLALAKVGAGTLTLTGASNYTGGTTINGGTLKVNGSLSAAGAVAVNTGTLAGTGSVGNVTLGASGMVAPGNGGVGALTAASLTWQDGHMTFDLSPVDNTSNQLIVQGLFSGAGGTTFTFDLSGGVVGETYTLVTFGSTDFTAGSQFTAAGGITGDFTLDTNSNTLNFTVAAVPEPGVVALLVMGGVCVTLVVRRRGRMA